MRQADELGMDFFACSFAQNLLLSVVVFAPAPAVPGLLPLLGKGDVFFFSLFFCQATKCRGELLSSCL